MTCSVPGVRMRTVCDQDWGGYTHIPIFSSIHFCKVLVSETLLMYFRIIDTFTRDLIENCISIFGVCSVRLLFTSVRPRL